MIEALISAGGAVLVGILSLLGVVLTTRKANAQMQSDLKTSQAVMEERLKELTREMRSAGALLERVPVIEEQIKVLNHRVADLEKKH